MVATPQLRSLKTRDLLSAPTKKIQLTPRQALKRLGVRLVWEHRPQHSYDRGVFTLPPELKRAEADLWHEVAHYQVAPDRWRRAPNFGLGSSPWCEDYLRRPLRSDRVIKLEESRASLLGICWARCRGYSATQLLDQHRWFMSASEAVDWYTIGRHLAWLQRHGLVDDQGVPVL